MNLAVLLTLALIGVAVFLCWQVFKPKNKQCVGDTNTPYNPGRPVEYYILNTLGLLALSVGIIRLWDAFSNGAQTVLLFAVGLVLTGVIACGFASIISATYRTEKLTAQILERLKK